MIGAPSFATPAFAIDKPNFLLILLDDAGWTDVECFGSRIQTPNINRLAAQGMRFTDCHSAAPNCSPSRAGLLTGRTPSRIGIYSYLPANHVMHLRKEEVTIAELLKEKGYRTGHFGKWHLSRLQSDQPGPADQGFDYSLGTDNNASPSHHNPQNFIRNGDRVGVIQGYSCQIVVNETLAWLTQKGRGVSETDGDDPPPFFACVWFHEPHQPIASPPELIEKYRQLYPQLTQKEATYHANIENVDKAIGRLLDQLDALELSDNTVIFFTSDNGPLNRFSSQGLRGQKSHVWEGGHRVPGIWRWPGKFPAGSSCDVPISGIDYLPTVCELAGIAPPDWKLDGQSILPLLTGHVEDFDRRQPLYWFFYRLNPAIALRSGSWSLIANTNDANRPKAHGLLREDMPAIKSSKPTEFQLYNLQTDLRQQNDLSTAKPDVLNTLRESMERMHADVLGESPVWDVPADYGANSNRKIWLSD